ncbi:MAG: hypothetical protein V4510_12730 [bacterium]
MTQAHDDETLKDIRRWYQEHGMPYQEDDWGLRSATGESEGRQMQEPERGTRSSASTPDRMWWWEKQQFPWRGRTPGEREWAETLEDFFTPYLALLPGPKLRLMEQVFNDTRTYAEVGEESGISRQGAHQSVQRALRALTRVIAEDNPNWESTGDGRSRDYDDEEEAARFVFVKYVTDRLGAS